MYNTHVHYHNISLYIYINIFTIGITMLHYIICIYTILSYESHAPVVFFLVEGGFLNTL